MEKLSKTSLSSDNSWDLFEKAVRISPRIFIHGPPGVGKSYTSWKILKTINSIVWQCSLDEDRVVQELLGHFLPQGSVFKWHNGPMATAFEEGHGLVINELARASSAVKDVFLGILDDPKVAMLRLPNNQILKRGKDFRVVATANNPPDDLDEALKDRFDVIVRVSTPHPAIIRDLNAGIKGLGNMILASYKDPKRAISPRRAYAFINLLKKLSPEEAAQLAFGERFKDVLVIMKTRSVKLPKKRHDR